MRAGQQYQTSSCRKFLGIRQILENNYKIATEAFTKLLQPDTNTLFFTILPAYDVYHLIIYICNLPSVHTLCSHHHQKKKQEEMKKYSQSRKKLKTENLGDMLIFRVFGDCQIFQFSRFDSTPLVEPEWLGRELSPPPPPTPKKHPVSMSNLALIQIRSIFFLVLDHLATFCFWLTFHFLQEMFPYENLRNSESCPEAGLLSTLRLGCLGIHILTQHL